MASMNSNAQLHDHRVRAVLLAQDPRLRGLDYQSRWTLGQGQLSYWLIGSYARSGHSCQPTWPKNARVRPLIAFARDGPRSVHRPAECYLRAWPDANQSQT
jgi:hypothetical protein